MDTSLTLTYKPEPKPEPEAERLARLQAETLHDVEIGKGKADLKIPEDQRAAPVTPQIKRTAPILVPEEVLHDLALMKDGAIQATPQEQSQTWRNKTREAIGLPLRDHPPLAVTRTPEGDRLRDYVLKSIARGTIQVTHTPVGAILTVEGTGDGALTPDDVRAELRKRWQDYQRSVSVQKEALRSGPPSGSAAEAEEAYRTNFRAALVHGEVWGATHSLRTPPLGLIFRGLHESHPSQKGLLQYKTPEVKQRLDALWEDYLRKKSFEDQTQNRKDK
jgi:hypothetical protein